MDELVMRPWPVICQIAMGYGWGSRLLPVTYPIATPTFVRDGRIIEA